MKFQISLGPPFLLSLISIYAGVSHPHLNPCICVINEKTTHDSKED
jgi:hypothetical protein